MSTTSRTRTIELTGSTADRNRADIVQRIAEALLEIRAAQSAMGDGDSSYVILDTRVEAASFYIQFLARADEPHVLWECASGFHGAPAVRRTTVAERRALLALGFSDGVRGNHGKHIEVDDLAAATRVADETVGILERTMRWSPSAQTTLQIVHCRNTSAMLPMRFEVRGVDTYDADDVLIKRGSHLLLGSFETLEDAIAFVRMNKALPHGGAPELRDRVMVLDRAVDEVVFTA